VKLALIVLVAGCGVVTTGGTSTTPTGPTGGGGGAGGETTAVVPPDGNGNLTVPNLVGKTEAEAAAMVKAAGFTNEMEHSQPVDCGDTAPKQAGKINCQSVEAGSKVARYTMIQVNIYEPQHFEGMLVRHQLEPLVGMTVDQGKTELVKMGFKGKVVVVNPFQFIDKCGMNKICGIEPQDGISTTDPTAEMHFTVNKNDVKISTPDP
jgi:hypothetical protein